MIKPSYFIMRLNQVLYKSVINVLTICVHDSIDLFIWK